MAELFKNIYSPAFFEKFTRAFTKVKPDFDTPSFINDIYDKEWEQRELKQRMRHIALCLKTQLPDEFQPNAQLILESIPYMIEEGYKPNNLEFIFYPDFIELYGMEYLEVSLKTIEQLTQYVSCEFAIRPFIIKYEEDLLIQCFDWSNHKSVDVRRLATEGIRPRLPWAVALESFKKNPESIIPILENLKEDPSEYVRRSVANNLNDISKGQPNLVIELTRSWLGENKETDKLLKHGNRTLLKQGLPAAMRLFGFGSVTDIKVENLQVLTPKVEVGQYLEFQFELLNKSPKSILLRLEYGMYYQKANGTLTRKVFKISEKNYAANSNTTIFKRQSFKPITTRKYHRGLHQVSIIINGVEMEKSDFHLV